MSPKPVAWTKPPVHHIDCLAREPDGPHKCTCGAGEKWVAVDFSRDNPIGLHAVKNAEGSLTISEREIRNEAYKQTLALQSRNHGKSLFALADVIRTAYRKVRSGEQEDSCFEAYGVVFGIYRAMPGKEMRITQQGNRTIALDASPDRAITEAITFVTGHRGQKESGPMPTSYIPIGHPTPEGEETPKLLAAVGDCNLAPISADEMAILADQIFECVDGGIDEFADERGVELFQMPNGDHAFMEYLDPTYRPAAQSAANPFAHEQEVMRIAYVMFRIAGINPVSVAKALELEIRKFLEDLIDQGLTHDLDKEAVFFSWRMQPKLSRANDGFYHAYARIGATWADRKFAEAPLLAAPNIDLVDVMNYATEAIKKMTGINSAQRSSEGFSTDPLKLVGWLPKGETVQFMMLVRHPQLRQTGNDWLVVRADSGKLFTILANGGDAQMRSVEPGDWRINAFYDALKEKLSVDRKRASDYEHDDLNGYESQEAWDAACDESHRIEARDERLAAALGSPLDFSLQRSPPEAMLLPDSQSGNTQRMPRRVNRTR